MALEKSKDSKDVFSEIVRRINEDRRRIKLIEQKMNRLENGISSLEGALISQMSDLKITLERMVGNMEATSIRLDKIESDIGKLKKVLSKSASKLELKQLESFIDLVNPITSRFVTKDELDRVLDDRMSKNSKKLRI